MMPEIVILSPHLDDAVLDCWHIITESKAVVINVFAGVPPEGTHTLWDRVCGEANSHKMMQKRRQENKAAVAICGANKQIYLDFFDNQYRTATPKINELIETILTKSPANCSYVVPLAMSKIYRHPDHVLIRHAGLELHKRGYQVGFYPDSPYMTLPRQFRSNSVKRIKNSSEKVLGIEVSVKINKLSRNRQASKIAAMHAFGTQYKMTNLESFGGLGRIGRRDYEIVVEPT